MSAILKIDGSRLKQKSKYSTVILSAAKNLCLVNGKIPHLVRNEKLTEILHFIQDDSSILKLPATNFQKLGRYQYNYPSQF